MALASWIRILATSAGAALAASAHAQPLEPRWDGYVFTTADGTCSVGFETSRFQPRLDHPPSLEEKMSSGWWVSGWPDFPGPPEPTRPPRRAALVWECRVTGWLSPPGRYGHMNMYGHEFQLKRMEILPSPPPER